MRARNFFLSCVLGTAVCAASASTFLACAEGAQLDDDDTADASPDAATPDATTITSSSSSSSSGASGGSSGASSGSSSSGGGEIECKLTINEISSESDDFVELFNPDGCDAIDLDAYSLVYRSAGGGSDVVLFDGDATTMAGGDFFVIGATAFSPKDAPFLTGALGAAGGQLALKEGSGSVDEVAYGSGSGTYGEGSAAPAPGADSISRTPDGNDTNDNADDFSVGSPTPGASNE